VNPLDPEGCGHDRLTPGDAADMLNRLYISGYGYYHIADLTRLLDLSHEDMRAFLARGFGGPGTQAQFLAEMRGAAWTVPAGAPRPHQALGVCWCARQHGLDEAIRLNKEADDGNVG
jgi:hypothetical protein